jgi:hypothetical protein
MAVALASVGALDDTPGSGVFHTPTLDLVWSYLSSKDVISAASRTSSAYGAIARV